MSDGWKRYVPITEAEIEAFCEDQGLVRPDPGDDRAVNSFAGWLSVWVAERREMWEPCEGTGARVG